MQVDAADFGQVEKYNSTSVLKQWKKHKQMESRTACVGEFGWGGKLLYGNGSFQRSAQRRQKRLVEHKGKSWTSIGYAVIVRNAKARLSDP